MHLAISGDAITRRKAAELLSTVGALVIGIGVGLWLPAVGAPLAAATLVVGVVSHALGMYEKNRIETQAGEAVPEWSRALYWLCWAALAAVVAWLALDFFA
jgi:hypothetical protein